MTKIDKPRETSKRPRGPAITMPRCAEAADVPRKVVFVLGMQFHHKKVGAHSEVNERNDCDLVADIEQALLKSSERYL